MSESTQNNVKKDEIENLIDNIVKLKLLKLYRIN